MISYQTRDDDKEINAILDKGLKDLNKITSLIGKYNQGNKQMMKGKSYYTEQQQKQRQQCVTEDNNHRNPMTVKTSNNKRPCKLTKPIKDSQITISDPIKSNVYSKNESYVSNVNQTEYNNESRLLRKTRDVLIHISRNNTPPKKSIRNKSNQPSQCDLKVLKEETNERWKEKYTLLQQEYNNIDKLLKKQIDNNNTLTKAIASSYQKEQDIPTLVQHNNKLKQVSSDLISQCKNNTISSEDNQKTIINLQRELTQLRHQFHSQPIHPRSIPNPPSIKKPKKPNLK